MSKGEVIVPEQPENTNPTGPPPPAKFETGTPVRVNGTVPGFEDIPLGGWSGTIIDVDHGSTPPGYLIQWDQRTLAAMPADFRQRCEQDGLELDCLWLDENAFEPASGEVSPVEQPTEIATPTLSRGDPADLIRMILGTSGDALPPTGNAGENRPVRIFTLAYQGRWPSRGPATPKSFLSLLFTICAMGALYGLVVGAAVAAVEGAAIAAKIVAILLGGGGCLLGAGYGLLFGAVNRIRYGPWLGGVVGATVAGMVGALLGVMLMAFLGTVLGGLAGSTLGRIINRLFHKPTATIQGVFGGGMLGVAVQAWLHDPQAAWTGVWTGAVVGAVVGPLLFFGIGIALTRR
jgi:hypothetical protein